MWYKVTIKTLQGASFDLQVEGSFTVKATKEKIATEHAELGSAATQKLIHSGKVLKDDTTLDENGVTAASFLVCMVTKAKGPYRGPLGPYAAERKHAQEPAPNRRGTKPVQQLDSSTSEVLRTFPSMKVALASLGKNPKSGNIYDACEGRKSTAYGFTWRWRQDQDEGGQRSHMDEAVTASGTCTSSQPVGSRGGLGSPQLIGWLRWGV